MQLSFISVPHFHLRNNEIFGLCSIFVLFSFQVFVAIEQRNGRCALGYGSSFLHTSYKRVFLLISIVYDTLTRFLNGIHFELLFYFVYRIGLCIQYTYTSNTDASTIFSIICIRIA